jgi:hypothetical protein
MAIQLEKKKLIEDLKLCYKYMQDCTPCLPVTFILSVIHDTILFLETHRTPSYHKCPIPNCKYCKDTSTK